MLTGLQKWKTKHTQVFWTVSETLVQKLDIDITDTLDKTQDRVF